MFNPKIHFFLFLEALNKIIFGKTKEDYIEKKQKKEWIDYFAGTKSQ